MPWFRRTALLLIASPAAHACAMGDSPAPRTASPDATECIDLTAVANRRVAGGGIRFDLIGGQRFSNRPAGRCPGLGASGSVGLAFEVQGNRLCRGDRVRVIDPQASAATSTTCLLGRFQPVRDAR